MNRRKSKLESRRIDAFIVSNPDTVMRICELKAIKNPVINPRRQVKKLLRLAERNSLNIR